MIADVEDAVLDEQRQRKEATPDEPLGYVLDCVVLDLIADEMPARNVLQRLADAVDLLAFLWSVDCLLEVV